MHGQPHIRFTNDRLVYKSFLMGLYVVVIAGCIIKQRMCQCIDNIRKSAVSAAGKETAELERWVDELGKQTLFTCETQIHGERPFFIRQQSLKLGKNVITTSWLAVLHPAMVPIVDQTKTNLSHHRIFWRPIFVASSSYKGPRRRSVFLSFELSHQNSVEGPYFYECYTALSILTSFTLNTNTALNENT